MESGCGDRRAICLALASAREGVRARSVPPRTACRSAFTCAGRGVVVYVVADPMAGRVPSVPRTSRRAAPGTAGMDAPDRRASRSARTLPSAAKKVVWNELLTPVKTETIDELRWYLRAGSRTRPTAVPQRRPGRAVRWPHAMPSTAPRFKARYRAWKQDGEPALAGAGSRAIRDAVDAGAGRVEAR